MTAELIFNSLLELELAHERERFEQTFALPIDPVVITEIRQVAWGMWRRGGNKPQ